MPKHAITLDFETYYDNEYTLRHMTTAQYVLDPRFEVIGVAVALDDKPIERASASHEELAQWLGGFPFEDAVVVAHNAIFDGAILEWVFNIEPAQYFCTMMGSRPFVAPWTGSMSLASVADHLQLGTKGHEVNLAKGIRREQFLQIQLDDYMRYCCNDVMLTRRAYKNLRLRLPDDEMALLDQTVKKFTRPKLQLDAQMIASRLEEVQVAKARALLTMPNGVSRDDLMSNARFAEVLRTLGATPPQKLSATTMKPTWAFAKDDAEFNELRTHPNPAIRAVVEARLLWKSSLEETRLQRLKSIRDLTPYLPVPLLYYGAHTGRFSGTDSLNLQNLTRPKKGQTGLRHCVVAPTGSQIVTVDLSQIEARIVATLAGQWDLMQLFRTGGDPYAAFATVAYGYEVKKSTHPIERFVGKTCILGLGYGMGGARLYAALKAAAAKENIPLDITESRAAELVTTYRRTYSRIPLLWKQMERLIGHMFEPKATHEWRMLTVSHNKITLPNGMAINYPYLWRDENNEVTYQSFMGKSAMKSKLWGGAFLENVVQALARIIISRAELRLARAGLPAALQVHDELVYVVPDASVDKVKQVLAMAMTDPVPWLPDLPLACEVGAGTSYGSAK